MEAATMPCLPHPAAPGGEPGDSHSSCTSSSPRGWTGHAGVAPGRSVDFVPSFQNESADRGKSKGLPEAEGSSAAPITSLLKWFILLQKTDTSSGALRSTPQLGRGKIKKERKNNNKNMF